MLSIYFLYFTLLIIISFFLIYLSNIFYSIRLVLHYQFWFNWAILIVLYLSIILYSKLYGFLNDYTIELVANIWLINYYFILFYFPFIFIFIIVTAVTIIFCFTYNFYELRSFYIYILVIWIAGLGLFYTNSLIYFFLFYELLLLPSFFILYSFAKTRKCVEAAFLMFFWTQFGALWLIFGFIFLYSISNTYYFSDFFLIPFTSFQVNILSAFFICGFGVKFPIWPFYDWLPKAHVEASTNFSIFLSGVLVKFAFFGFIKCILSLQLEPTLYWIFPVLFIGLVDSISKVYYQIDLKKLIAYATVIEMHWLLLVILNGQSVLWLTAFYMLISHALISSNFFLLVDAVTRRFKTRLISEVTGLVWLTPWLYFLLLSLLVVFLGFPGSLFFLAEVSFFLFYLDINTTWACILLLFIYGYFSICFFKNWFILLFNYSYIFMSSILIRDLDLKELFLFSFFLFMLYWLGLINQFIVI